MDKSKQMPKILIYIWLIFSILACIIALSIDIKFALFCLGCYLSVYGAVKQLIEFLEREDDENNKRNKQPY